MRCDTDWPDSAQRRTGIVGGRTGDLHAMPVAILAAVVSLFISRAIGAADGSFDPTWAGGGRIVFSGNPNTSLDNTGVAQILLEGNGRLLVGGYDNNFPSNVTTWFVGELFPSGTAVPTYGASNGSGMNSGCALSAALSMLHGSLFRGMALTTDGRVNVLNSFVLARTSVGAGALDTGGVAGGTGHVDVAPLQINDVKGNFGEAIAIAPATGGKWFLAGDGYYSQVATNSDFALVRLNADLSLDMSFNARTDSNMVTFAGGVLVPFDLGGSAFDFATHILVQTDGRIWLVGNAGTASGSVTSLARLDSDGTLDATFGSGSGKSVPSWSQGTFAQNSYPGAAKLDANGRLLLACSATLTGQTVAGMGVARILADGTLDAGFGSGGISRQISPLCTQGAGAYALALDSAGRIIVAGACSLAGSSAEILLARLHGDDGTLDTTFGIGGFSHGSFGDTSTSDYASDIVIDASGHPVFAGTSTVSGSNDMSGVGRVTYDLIYTNNFEKAPPGRLAGQ